MSFWQFYDPETAQRIILMNTKAFGLQIKVYQKENSNKTVLIMCTENIYMYICINLKLEIIQINQEKSTQHQNNNPIFKAQEIQQMIPNQQFRLSKTTNASLQFLEKVFKLDITKLGVNAVREFYVAGKNGFIIVDEQYDPNWATFASHAVNEEYLQQFRQVQMTNQVPVPNPTHTDPPPSLTLNMNPNPTLNNQLSHVNSGAFSPQYIMSTTNNTAASTTNTNNTKIHPTHKPAGNQMSSSGSGPGLRSLGFNAPHPNPQGQQSGLGGGTGLNVQGASNQSNQGVGNTIQNTNITVNLPPNLAASIKSSHSHHPNPALTSQTANNQVQASSTNPSAVTKSFASNKNSPIYRIINFTQDCKILGQFVIEQPEYQIFMMSQSYLNIYQYCNMKKNSSIIQWNIQNNQVISVKYNREIFPMVKIFCFAQSDTFCIVQYDKHSNTQDQNTENSQKQRSGTSGINQQTQQHYHTKFKLAYYKFPLKKTIQKPYMVFKTHTNPKQYGFHQQIIKLNNHSMIGSISTKMNENDQTLLKTYDFRNNSSGVEVNYKFHVQINYRKELLQLWVGDIWEIRPENFYLKCQLRLDKNKEELYSKQYPKLANELDNLEQCLHLTWNYKYQNTLKYAKFKTPLLNQIQFIDSFKHKQRSRIISQKIINKQKIIRIDNLYQPSPSSSISSNSTSGSYLSSMQMSPGQQKVEQMYSTPSYARSIQKLPVYFVSNWTQQFVYIQRQYTDHMATYPAYSPRMITYYKLTCNKDEKILDVTLHKIRENYSNRELSVFMLNAVYKDWDGDLIRSVYLLNEEVCKPKDLEPGWYFLDCGKNIREKSKSNIQIK